MDTPEKIKNLRSSLKIRQNGVTHFDVQPVAPFKSVDYTDILDRYVVSQGFYPIGVHWVWVDRYNIVGIITKLIHRTMPFDTETMLFKSAVQLAVDMLFIFDNDVQCFTNHDDLKNEHFGVGTATFEQGVVLYDRKYIGHIWILEED